MTERVPHALGVATLLVALVLTSVGRADWPMPGHDPARSSWASQDKVEAALRPIWHRKIGPYIPSKVQIITVAAAGRVPALVLVSTSRGCTRWIQPTAHELWHYPTDDAHRPVADGSGRRRLLWFAPTRRSTRWTPPRASGSGRLFRPARPSTPIRSSPTAACFIGCRDGYFYAFDAATGSSAVELSR